MAVAEKVNLASKIDMSGWFKDINANMDNTQTNIEKLNTRRYFRWVSFFLSNVKIKYSSTTISNISKA